MEYNALTSLISSLPWESPLVGDQIGFFTCYYPCSVFCVPHPHPSFSFVMSFCKKNIFLLGTGPFHSPSFIVSSIPHHPVPTHTKILHLQISCWKELAEFPVPSVSLSPLLSEFHAIYNCTVCISFYNHRMVKQFLTLSKNKKK